MGFILKYDNNGIFALMYIYSCLGACHWIGAHEDQGHFMYHHSNHSASRLLAECLQALLSFILLLGDIVS